MIIARSKEEIKEQILQYEHNASIYLKHARLLMRKFRQIGVLTLDDGVIIQCPTYKGFKTCVKLNKFEIADVSFVGRTDN
jgi:hypothetical protein